jgi:biotin carboxyl carrier protein
VAYEVEVEVLDAGEGFPPAGSLPSPRRQAAAALAATAPKPAGPSKAGTDEGGVASPIAGTIVEIKCKVGEVVTKGQVLLVMEAMKMKTSIAAPTDGKVKAIPIAVGDSVRENQMLVAFE